MREFGHELYIYSCGNDSEVFGVFKVYLVCTVHYTRSRVRFTPEVLKLHFLQLIPVESKKIDDFDYRKFPSSFVDFVSCSRLYMPNICYSVNRPAFMENAISVYNYTVNFK